MLTTYGGDGVDVGSGEAEVTDDLQAAVVRRQVEGSSAVLHEETRRDDSVLILALDINESPHGVQTLVVVSKNRHLNAMEEPGVAEGRNDAS
ncbi:hypothetical protein EYF80_041116 [Liparis tanakae]|uniref:Uncharacterized protein n=1 Tax=Liparis tanakae TaxID=230148 RepID=A0A4Z2G568_9TELE|nr:hypothetical protein EYF80_041116 [Liparis tanakae]